MLQPRTEKLLQVTLIVHLAGVVLTALAWIGSILYAVL